MAASLGSGSVGALIPTFAVERPRLVDRLDAGLHRRLTLLVAPPGYGKSTLLGLWATAHPERKRAWLTVDASHDDATRFGRRLVESVAVLDPDFGRAALERLDATGQALGKAFVAAFVEEAAGLPEAVVAIEDLGLLTNAALIGEVGRLLTRLPAHLHVVVASRSDPRLPVQNLRLLGEVAELRQDELAFGPEEAAELVLRIADRRLSSPQVDTLMARTEGWPAGLQLAALSLQGRDEVGPFLEVFSGDDRYVADYLSETVLDHLPVSLARFLLETSVLDRLTAPLCDAVTGGDDGQRMLEELSRRSLFVVPLDNRRRWFRYHPLFRDLLRYRLRADEPRREEALLARAAAWHLEEGDVAEAARYLIRSRRWDDVLALVVAHGGSMLEAGEAGTVLRWLEAIPERLRAGRPDAELGRAALYAGAGNGAAAERLLSSFHGNGAAGGVQIAADVLRTLLVQLHLPPDRVVATADRVLTAVGEVGDDDVPDVFGIVRRDLIRPVALLSKGRALFYQGLDIDARCCLEAALDELDGGHPAVLIEALGALALVAAWDDDLTGAENLAKRALSTAAEVGLVTHAALIDAYLATGHVRRQRNDLALAAVALDEGRLRALQNRRVVPMAVYRVEAARLRLAMGDPHEGLAVLSQQRTSGHPPPPANIAAHLTAAQVALLVAVGDVDRAQRVLASDDVKCVPELSAARVAVALARGEISRARKTLNDWPARDAASGALPKRRLWEAVVDEREGESRHARRRMQEVVESASEQGAVRMLTDAGIDTQRLVRSLYHEGPTSFLRRVVEAIAVPPATERNVSGLVESLSEREIMVLRYLPSRLSNQEIAEHLYVSVNTLKTHLKHLYRKLGVTSRVEAIVRAESLGLL